MGKGGRSGRKKRLYMSAKRRKRQISIKRKIHFESQDHATSSAPIDTFLSSIENNISSSSSTVSTLYDLDVNTESSFKTDKENKNLEGRRVVDIKYLFSKIAGTSIQAVHLLTLHLLKNDAKVSTANLYLSVRCAKRRKRYIPKNPTIKCL
jgi:hypothetical protein